MIERVELDDAIGVGARFRGNDTRAIRRIELERAAAGLRQRFARLPLLARSVQCGQCCVLCLLSAVDLREDGRLNGLGMAPGRFAGGERFRNGALILVEDRQRH